MQARMQCPIQLLVRGGTLTLAAALLVAGAATADVAPATKAASTPASAPATITLPGVTGKDANPNGCVSCHTGTETLNKVLAKAKHKNVDAKTKVVPDDCAKCHEPDGDIDSLQTVVHSTHYGDAARNAFVTRHGGQCLHCHAMDPESGAVAIKNGAKNW